MQTAERRKDGDAATNVSETELPRPPLIVE
jgi:hypothetical protein